jgi:hypothetical protein
MPLAVVTVLLCVQLEVPQSQNYNACRKAVFDRGIWLIANGGGIRVSCLSHAQSASSSDISNIILTYYMRNATSLKYILSWQQSIGAGPCTKLPLNSGPQH